jgi:hypothetical protein
MAKSLRCLLAILPFIYAIEKKIKSAPFSIFILTSKIGHQDFYCRSYLFLDRCFNRYILLNISKKADRTQHSFEKTSGISLATYALKGFKTKNHKPFITP